MNRQIIITASVLGMLAVISGAFAAHGLKQYLSASNSKFGIPACNTSFTMFLHLLFLSHNCRPDNRLVRTAYYLFTAWYPVFLGSLYLLACRELLGWSWLIDNGADNTLGRLAVYCGWATGLAAFRVT